MIDMVFDYLVNPTFVDGKKRNKLDSMNTIQVQLFMFFLQLANRLFEYKNLPDEIEPYVIERQLFFYGQSVFFERNNVKMLLPCANNGTLNLYAQPIRVIPIGMAGYSFDEVWVRDEYQLPDMNLLHNKDAVIIKNNELSMSTYALIKPFVEKLAYIWESMGINNALSRIKYLVKANKDLAPAIKTQINDILGNKSPIAVVNDKKNLMSDMEKLDFDVAYTPKEYWYDFDKTFNIILTLLGIDNNMESEKKERLLVDEVNSNNLLVTMSLETRKHFREYAVGEINKMFNTTIEVVTKDLDTQEMGRGDKEKENNPSSSTDNPLSSKFDK